VSSAAEWAARSGDSWAERWRDTDRGLAPVGAALHGAVLEAAPAGPFDVLDIGCGAGATSLALAEARADARIVGCDLSPALIGVAKRRATGLASVDFRVGDAVQVAAQNGPFDLFLSRHGVMFFPDPAAAFETFRNCAREGAPLVFSCFKGWDENPWASELASAAAGRKLPPPGREPSGFAFADPCYVATLLESAGWTPSAPQPLEFRYVAGEGGSAVDHALAYLTEIGPASAVLREMPAEHRPAAVERMRGVIEQYHEHGAVRFPAVAWIWRARAGRARS
jgi:SAM-dependent methyltransferase